MIVKKHYATRLLDSINFNDFVIRSDHLIVAAFKRNIETDGIRIIVT